VALGPVVAGASLAEDKVVRAEQLTERTSAHRVHGTRLQIHKDSARHVTATSGFVEIHVDALELEVAVTVVSAGWVHTVL